MLKKLLVRIFSRKAKKVSLNKRIRQFWEDYWATDRLGTCI